MRLADTAEALFQHALAHSVIGLDQTGWPKLDGKGDKPWQMVPADFPTVSAVSVGSVKTLRI